MDTMEQVRIVVLTHSWVKRLLFDSQSLGFIQHSHLTLRLDELGFRDWARWGHLETPEGSHGGNFEGAAGSPYGIPRNFSEYRPGVGDSKSR